MEQQFVFWISFFLFTLYTSFRFHFSFFHSLLLYFSPLSFCSPSQLLIVSLFALPAPFLCCIHLPVISSPGSFFHSHHSLSIQAFQVLAGSSIIFPTFPFLPFCCFLCLSPGLCPAVSLFSFTYLIKESLVVSRVFHSYSP